MCRQAARQRRRKCVEESCSASRAASGGSQRGGHAGYEKMSTDCRMAVSTTHRVSPITRSVKAPLRGACVGVSLDVVRYCPTRRRNRVGQFYKLGESDFSSSETVCLPCSSTRSPAATADAELARGGGTLRGRVGVGPDVAWRGHASRRDERPSGHEARRSRAEVAAAFGDASRARRGTWGRLG